MAAVRARNSGVGRSGRDADDNRLGFVDRASIPATPITPGSSVMISLRSVTLKI
jgi:hypothetical protein